MTTASTDLPFQLDHEWIVWLEENLALGVPSLKIAEAMEGRGCPADMAKVLIEAFQLRSHHHVRGGGRRLAKTRWLLDALRSMQAPEGGAPLADLKSLDTGVFFTSFYARNFPVVYRQSLTPGSLSDLLSWERLEREFGAMEIEIQEGRNGRSDYERASGELKSRTKLADFLQRAQSAEDNNDFYMTANNSSANSTLIESAIQPESVCPELLDGRMAHGRVFLWIGPRGTFTPAHHDLTNNLFMQVHGSKEFRLASSLALPELDNDRHCFLATSLVETDERRKAEGLPPISFTVTLQAGDVLFIPLGWWHEVRGLSASISLSATNFRAKNDFHLSYEFYGPLTD